MKMIAVLLTAASLLLLYDIGQGKGGWQNFSSLATRLDQAEAHNQELQIRNAAIAAEINDLNRGSDAIMETARRDLGYIKKGEIYYQIQSK